MLKRYVVLVALVAMSTLTSLSAYGQTEQTGLENQPVTTNRQEEGDGQSEQKATHTGPITVDITPSLQRIDAAINLLIPQDDEEERQRTSEREVRDLQAQENMAWWAMCMLVASAAGVVVTLAGLLLIWRTLHHTKIAAEASKAMVDEAKATTQAARDTIAETREIGRKQTRAYLHCVGLSYSSRGNSLYINPHISNVGQSPAVSCVVKGSVDIGRHIEGKYTTIKSSIDESSDEQIASGTIGIAELLADIEPAHQQIRHSISDEWTEISGQIYISWLDVFGDRQGIVAEFKKGSDAGLNINSDRRSDRWLVVVSQYGWDDEYGEE